MPVSFTNLAFGAIFIDDKLLEKIKAYFDVGNIIIAISCTLIAVFWFIYLYRKRSAFNNMIFEVYMVLGGLVTLSALTYYCKDIGMFFQTKARSPGSSSQNPCELVT